MQSSSSSSLAPSPSASFAGVLADFTEPEKKFPPASDFDGLEDDIATITYENALRGLHRVASKAADLDEGSSAIPDKEMIAAAIAGLLAGDPAGRRTSAPAPAPAPIVNEAERKSASVTVRMSHAECEQLRARAAEAGLTVSAYLRSCAFEVETLRAQVKETVASLRAASAQQIPQPAAMATPVRARAQNPVPTPASETSASGAQSGSKARWWSRFSPPAKQRPLTA